MDERATSGAEAEAGRPGTPEEIRIFELPNAKILVKEANGFKDPAADHEADAIGHSFPCKTSHSADKIPRIGINIVIIVAFSNCRADHVESPILRKSEQLLKPTRREENIIIQKKKPF